MIKLNDVLELDIDDISVDGKGIGKVSGFTLFVDGVLPGERTFVKVNRLKKSYGFASLVEIIKESPHRKKPDCNDFNRCGGCTIMHLNYPAQLEYKKNKVTQCLKRISGLSSEEEEVIKGLQITGMESCNNYRNSGTFHLSMDNHELKIGFYGAESHNVISIKDCGIIHEGYKEVLDIITRFVYDYNIPVYDNQSNTGLLRHIVYKTAFATGEKMVCLVINGKKLPYAKELTDSIGKVGGMQCIALVNNTSKGSAVMMGEIKVIWGSQYITEGIGKFKYQISPGAFFQVNPVQTKVLYDKIIELARFKKSDIVLDAFCGIGTISIYIAGHVKKVLGIEIIEQAIVNAKNNARLNGINNAEFFMGAAEDIACRLLNENNPDAVIVDPPRKGCESGLLAAFNKAKVKKVVYVSCDSGTLARDIKQLKEGGFKISRGALVDNFPMSTHIESILILER